MLLSFAFWPQLFRHLDSA